MAGVEGAANMPAYSASKGAVMSLNRAASKDLAPLGIRVNALAPGWVRTPFTESLEQDQVLHERLKTASPMHRAAEPEEMVGMVIFLCSDAASYITGQSFVVDGGQMIRGLLQLEVPDLHLV